MKPQQVCEFVHGLKGFKYSRFAALGGSMVFLLLALFLLATQYRGGEQVFARQYPSPHPPVFGVRGVAQKSAVGVFPAAVEQGAVIGEAYSGPLTVPSLPVEGELEVPFSVDEGDPRVAPIKERHLLRPDSPTPAASFLALGDNNTRIPPDTMGAVGPNHLMVTLNSEVRIQNKTGGVISTTSLQNFWSPLGPFLTTIGVFDPRIHYDPYGGRWIHVACADPRHTNSSVVVAVSQTNDPTGLWNFYGIDVDSADLLWADYPSLGFNKDWIVVQFNMYNMTSNFSRSEVYAFDKLNLYSGGAGNFTALPITGQGGTHVPMVTYDNLLSTVYLLQNYNGDSGGFGFLALWSITGAVGSESLSFVSWIFTPNTWETFPSVGWNDFAPQLGDPRLVMNNDARIQNVIYRNGSLWATHTVFLPADGLVGSSASRSAVQWWEISPTAITINQFGRLEDVTGNTFYAFPSIGVNRF